MNNLEDIYNQAIGMLKKGHSQEEVLVKFAQYRQELAPLLKLSQSLLSVPKNIVPTPLMRRKYATLPVKNFWLAWIHVSKFAGVSVSLMLLISATAVMGYGVSKSTPGKTLFAVKKSAEKLELLLAYNQNKKASLQVAIANQRLSDAQKVFGDPQSNDSQKNAALTELSDQTSTAIATVKTAAKDNPKSDQNHPLINSLDSITSQQQTLLTAIKPDSQTQTATQSALVALDQNTSQISEIKESMSVADSDQTLVHLTANPNPAATNATSTPSQKPEVKSATTQGLATSSTTPVTSSTTQSTALTKKPDTASSTSATTSTTTPIDPNIATGSYIFEDPSPHFVQ